MNKKSLYALWGFLFILCAGLGFIPEPAGALKTLMTLLAIACFLPPAVLLYCADSADRTLIRNLSALSLGLSLVLLIANFLSAYASDTLGTILYYILVTVSSPMICSGHWAMSLFLWACLLMASLKDPRKN